MKATLTQARSRWREDQQRAAELANRMPAAPVDLDELHHQVLAAVDAYSAAVRQAEPGKLSAVVAAGEHLDVVIGVLLEVAADAIGPNLAQMVSVSRRHWARVSDRPARTAEAIAVALSPEASAS